MGGVAVAAVGLAAFFLLRGGDDDRETASPRPTPALPAAGPADRAPTAHGGSEVVEPAAEPAPTALADAAPAELPEPDPAAATAGDEPAPSAGPARSGKRRKRRVDDQSKPGSLYDSPAGKLRVPR